MRTRIALSILATSLLVAFGLAQSNPGEIHGVVTDVAGAFIPGVRVTLAGPEQRSTTTDVRGEFVFRNLRPGKLPSCDSNWPDSRRPDEVGVSTRVERLKITMTRRSADRKRHRSSRQRTKPTRSAQCAGAPESLSAASWGGHGTGGVAAAGGGARKWECGRRAPAPSLPGRYNPNFNTKATTTSTRIRFAGSRPIRSRRSRSTSTRPRTPTCGGS